MLSVCPCLGVGDAVFGLASGSLGSHVQTPAETVAIMPANLSYEAVSTTPTVFITVDTAFRHAAACQPGEKVLIHAAAGGVGLAGIQVAASLGGIPVATGGSSNKRALVR
jgi:NADPH:quinone reductase-like Zn-dependent oxidoreductase